MKFEEKITWWRRYTNGHKLATLWFLCDARSSRFINSFTLFYLFRTKLLLASLSLSLSLSIYLSQSVSPTTHSLHIVFLHSLVYHPLSLSLIVTVVVKYSLSSNLSSRSHVRTRVKVLSCAALSNCHTHVHVCAPAADEADAVASDAFQVYTLKP